VSGFGLRGTQLSRQRCNASFLDDQPLQQQVGLLEPDERIQGKRFDSEIGEALSDVFG